MRKLTTTWMTAALLWLSSVAQAAEVRVAVAANFAKPFQVLAAEFTKKTGHQVTLSSGATGKFYAQIKNGAPYDVLLAADEAVPNQLEADGLTVAGSRFTYAIGKLVLFSSKSRYVDPQGEVLRTGSFRHLAIANPKLAPYGSAAISVLTRMGLLEMLRPRLVQGENIAQTMEFAATGNAELAFVALSQMLVGGKARAGSYWLVPESLYPELRQDAVTLKSGAGNAAARALSEFLKSEGTRATIAALGYGLPKPVQTALPLAAPKPSPAPSSGVPALPHPAPAPPAPAPSGKSP